MDMSSLLDYPGENDTSSKIQSLEEIANTILENNIENDVDDNAILMEPVTSKAFNSSKILYNFMIQFEIITPDLLDAIRKIKDVIQED